MGKPKTHSASQVLAMLANAPLALEALRLEAKARGAPFSSVAPIAEVMAWLHTAIRDETEFARLRSLPGVRVEHFGGSRTFDTVLRLNGADLATKTDTLKRGKVASTHYFFSPGAL